jgi:hypothetical protein
MQEAIYRAGGRVLYCNTDSLLVRTCDVESLGVDLGYDLGQFKVELTAKTFICVGPKKYLYVKEDGSVKNCFGRPSVKWFDDELKKIK